MTSKASTAIPLWILLMVGTSLAQPPAQRPVGSAAPRAQGTYAAAEPAASLDQVHLVYSRQTTFDIPFNVTAGSNGPLEVHLYVSQDRGRTWEISSRQPAGSSTFQFRAPRDGEFWFTSDTVNPQAPPVPSNNLKPQLKVVIDTIQPKLQLRASVEPSGQVRAHWSATDANLVPDSMRLEYRTDEQAPWQPVAFHQGQALSPGNVEGHVSWYARGPNLMVRAEVQDAAQNRSVAVARVASGGQSAQVAARPNTVAGNQSRGAVDPFQQYDRARADETRNAGQGGSIPTTSASLQLNGPAGTGLIADEDRVPSPPPFPPNYRQSPPTSAANQARIAHLPPATSQPPGSTQNAGSYQTVAGPSQPDFATPASTGSHESTPASGFQPRMTNSREFALEYEVDSVPEGVAKVELWMTTDGGQGWSKWGDDPDRTSPFEVTVNQDGFFGFRIVVVSNNRTSSLRPKDNEPADIWIGVDTTRPEAKIEAAEYGKQADAGKLLIRWRAADTRLAARPITLRFAAHPDGPWTTIASGLPNHGQYLWPADPNLPPEIYLRLEAIDEAGNTKIDQLRDPIRAAGLLPKGRIRGFRPGGSSAMRLGPPNLRR